LPEAGDADPSGCTDIALAAGIMRAGRRYFALGPTFIAHEIATLT
jgi:hypothetical protein